MSRTVKQKEEERFYLLPGMGGQALQRKRRLMLRWSILAGVVVSALLAGILYWMNLH